MHYFGDKGYHLQEEGSQVPLAPSFPSSPAPNRGVRRRRHHGTWPFRAMPFVPPPLAADGRRRGRACVTPDSPPHPTPHGGGWGLGRGWPCGAPGPTAGPEFISYMPPNRLQAPCLLSLHRICRSKPPWPRGSLLSNHRTPHLRDIAASPRLLMAGLN